MEGYQLFHSSRTDSNGGGAALFIDNDLNYTCVESMTMNIGDWLQCITVEINMDKRKNIVVTVPCKSIHPPDDYQDFPL